MMTACNANLARGHHQELTALKLLSVFIEYHIEVFNFGLQGSSWKPKENDAGVQTEYGRFCTSMQFYSPDVLLCERQG